MSVSNINQAIKLLKDYSKNSYAQAYLNDIPNVIEESGTEGLCVQLLYILENSKEWKGDLALETKTYIKKWIKEKKGKLNGKQR